MSRQGRTQLVLGLLLIVLGGWFLADRNLPAFHEMFARYIQWPFSLITIGAGLFVLGLVLGAPGMSVPAAVVAGIGGLFYYFTKIGDWTDWYMWLLVPGFVGVGAVVAGLLGDSTRHNIRRGLNLMAISGVLFLVFSSLFGGWNQLGTLGPAIFIILLGLWLLGNGLYRGWRQRQYMRDMSERKEEDRRA